MKEINSSTARRNEKTAPASRVPGRTTKRTPDHAAEQPGERARSSEGLPGTGPGTGPDTGPANGTSTGPGSSRGGSGSSDVLAEVQATPIKVRTPHAAPVVVPAPSPTPEAATLTDAEKFFNRDLSWLEFNLRVLAQAEDPGIPLLERVKFLAIFSSNLDEFFMKRVGLIRRQVNSGIEQLSPDGMTPRQQLSAIRAAVQDLQARQASIYLTQIVPALASAGIHVVRWQDLSSRERAFAEDWHRRHAFPALTPLAVDKGHGFPFISNLSDNLAILIEPPTNGYVAREEGAPAKEPPFIRVKVPDRIRRFVPLPDGAEGRCVRLLPVSEVVRHNLDDLFPGARVIEHVHFRVTRSSGVQGPAHEGAETGNLLESVEAELRQRRFARVVRVEIEPDPAPALLRQLLNRLNIDAQDVYERQGPMDYGALMEIADLDRPELKRKPWRPVVPARLARTKTGKPQDLFACIRRQDVLLHHPYESFNESVERFIATAAADPDVIAIKQTLYRTSPDSPFIESLVRAAEAGKQVACLVEVRARFDEQRNLRFVHQLRRAGVHVAYGVVGLKTHCKVAMVVRKERQGLRCYAHIGTGNYNPKTAQLYTDLGLLTCDTDLTSDLINLFNQLTGVPVPRSYDTLLVAPDNMRARFNMMIDREIEIARRAKRRADAGEEPPPVGGRIIAKFNSLEDIRITERLYEASRAGVKITLVVRGFCCLRPGIPGLSENIEVISVVGRFLEHSRIFHFGCGREDPLEGEWYIGSADWMYRNLNARMEVITPVRDPDARARLKRIIDVNLADARKAWKLNPDGTYVRRTPPPDAAPDSAEVLGSFEVLMRDAAGLAAKPKRPS
ncbi:MAG: polyphosphate kinase 1 [Planctomycetota bacterium]|nr:polyphosphate kinase 1 [Planctomycetota bacterium]